MEGRRRVGDGQLNENFQLKVRKSFWKPSKESLSETLTHRPAPRQTIENRLKDSPPAPVFPMSISRHFAMFAHRKKRSIFAESLNRSIGKGNADLPVTREGSAPLLLNSLTNTKLSSLLPSPLLFFRLLYNLRRVKKSRKSFSSCSQNSLIFHHSSAGENLNFAKPSSAHKAGKKTTNLFASRLNLFIALLHNFSSTECLILRLSTGWLFLPFLSSERFSAGWGEKVWKEWIKLSPDLSTFFTTDWSAHEDRREWRNYLICRT